MPNITFHGVDDLDTTEHANFKLGCSTPFRPKYLILEYFGLDNTETFRVQITVKVVIFACVIFWLQQFLTFLVVLKFLFSAILHRPTHKINSIAF